MYFRKWFFENENASKNLLSAIYDDPTDITNYLVAADTLTDVEETSGFKGTRVSNFLRDFGNLLSNNLNNVGPIYKFLSLHQNQLQELDHLHPGISAKLVFPFKNILGLVSIINEFLPKEFNKKDTRSVNKDINSTILANADVENYRFTAFLMSNVFEDQKGLYKVTRVNNHGMQTYPNMNPLSQEETEIFYKVNREFVTSLAPLNEFLAQFVKRTPNYKG